MPNQSSDSGVSGGLRHLRVVSQDRRLAVLNWEPQVETLSVYAPKDVSYQGLWREGTESPKGRGPPRTDRPLGVQGGRVEGRLDLQRKKHGGAQKTQRLSVSPQSQLAPPRSAPRQASLSRDLEGSGTRRSVLEPRGGSHSQPPAAGTQPSSRGFPRSPTRLSRSARPLALSPC